MVYLYATNVSMLEDPLENCSRMDAFSAERKEKVLSQKQKKKRLQSLGAGLLLNKVLNPYGLSMEAVQFDANGKPFVDGVCFNLSHSGDMVICAVSENEVGCDIEQIKDAPRLVAEKAFSLEEREQLQQISDELYNKEFFRIWTKKESFLKMKGTGIRGVIRELEFDSCYIREYEIPGYQITVCAKEPEFSELIWEDF